MTAYAVDPGIVSTEIMRHMMRPIVALTKTFGFFIKTPAEGAYTTVYCTVTPENQLLTGGYYKSVFRANKELVVSVLCNRQTLS